MQNRYVYPAIFEYANDGISIEFPDLAGCLPCAQSTEEAMKNAKEALALHLYGMEKDYDEIPRPSDIRNIQHEQNQAVVLVDVWMPPFRDEIENKAVKKTLTIPKWLDDLAADNNINYSQTLQEALKQQLGILDKRS